MSTALSHSPESMRSTACDVCGIEHALTANALRTRLSGHSPS